MNEPLALAAPVFIQVRDGAKIGKRGDREVTVLGGVNAIEIFNPRRTPALQARGDLELKPGAIYRISTGFKTDAIGLILSCAHQITKEAVLESGIQLVRVDLDDSGELIFFVATTANWVFKPGFPLVELWLPTMPVLKHQDAMRIDSVAGPAVMTSVEPPKPGKESSVGAKAAAEISDEKFKKWLDDDPKAEGQTSQPAPPVAFPTVRAHGVDDAVVRPAK